MTYYLLKSSLYSEENKSIKDGEVIKVTFITLTFPACGPRGDEAEHSNNSWVCRIVELYDSLAFTGILCLPKEGERGKVE